jgi:hypothetical protein
MQYQYKMGEIKKLPYERKLFFFHRGVLQLFLINTLYISYLHKPCYTPINPVILP